MPAAPSVLRPLLAATLVIALAGCGGMRDSKLNPFNWFKRSETRVAVDVPEDPADTRPLVETVLDLKVEPIPGGAIVRARGLPPTQGWWDAELVLKPTDETGVLVYEFRLSPPDRATDTNVPRSREIDVAIYVSDYKLEFVNEIVVQGATNARSASR
jgi:hypothetical protein